MTIIIGRCEHGLVVAAAVEGRVSQGFLDKMTGSYSLERQHEPVTMQHCLPCAERVDRNHKLLATPDPKETQR
jgi:hypothetical protein